MSFYSSTSIVHHVEISLEESLMLSYLIDRQCITDTPNSRLANTVEYKIEWDECLLTVKLQMGSSIEKTSDHTLLIFNASLKYWAPILLILFRLRFIWVRVWVKWTNQFEMRQEQIVSHLVDSQDITKISCSLIADDDSFKI